MEKLVANPLLLFTSAAAAFGLVKAAEEITTRFGYITLPFAGLIFCILLIFHYRDQLDIFPEPARERETYKLFVPTMPDKREHLDAILEVIEVSQEVFGPDALNAANDIRSWRDDPYSIVILKSGEEIVGFIDFYYFTRADFETYLSGEVDFHALHATKTLAHPAARTAEVAYVGTILHVDFLRYLRSDSQYSKEISLLISGAIDAFLKYQEIPPTGLDVYSLGWSREGRRFLSKFGFTEDPHGKETLFNRQALYSRRNTTREQLVSLKRESAERRTRISREI
jgi:hypothetical protein